MADKKGGADFFQTVLMFGLLIGICIWVGTIIAARGEARLAAACKPLEIGTDFVHSVTASLIGHQPTWTLYGQQYLMGGCYYFFSIVLTPYLKDSGEVGQQIGGVRG